jgi:hypothetical protein
MKTQTHSEGFESTYALIMRSEEKERGLFEGAVYFAVVLSALFSIWQVAQQPAPPTLTSVHMTSIAQPANTNQGA